MDQHATFHHLHNVLRKLKKYKVLYISDEASMVPKHTLEASDILLGHITQSHKQMSLLETRFWRQGGTFDKLPIVPRAKLSVHIENTIKKAISKHFIYKQTCEPSRQQDFASWQQLLKRIY